MREMGKLGQRVPPTPGVEQGKCFGDVEWRQACLIAKVIDRIAPWDIMEGKFEDDELKWKLDEAARTVNEGLGRIEAADEGVNEREDTVTRHAIKDNMQFAQSQPQDSQQACPHPRSMMPASSLDTREATSQSRSSLLGISEISWNISEPRNLSLGL